MRNRKELAAVLAAVLLTNAIEFADSLRLLP